MCFFLAVTLALEALWFIISIIIIIAIITALLWLSPGTFLMLPPLSLSLCWLSQPARALQSWFLHLKTEFGPCMSCCLVRRLWHCRRKQKWRLSCLPVSNRGSDDRRRKITSWLFWLKSRSWWWLTDLTASSYLTYIGLKSTLLKHFCLSSYLNHSPSN